MDQNSAPNLILVKTALDKLFDDATIEQAVACKATALDPILFTQTTATNAAINSSVLGGGGYFQTTTDDVPLVNEASLAAAALKTSLVYQFIQNMPIARTFMADQQLDAVSKGVKQRAMAYTASRDRKAFSVYALGFTTQLTIDGVALFRLRELHGKADGQVFA